MCTVQYMENIVHRAIYARMRVFSDLYFPVHGKTRVLALQCLSYYEITLEDLVAFFTMETVTEYTEYSKLSFNSS